MRSDFKPLHLQKANRKLEAHVLASEQYQKQHNVHKELSLWKKFLRLFKNNPFELPEDLYKNI